MIQILKRWLAPPGFPDDEEKTSLAALINIALLGPILMMLMFLAVLYFNPGLPRALLIVDLVALGFSLQCWRWLHAGKLGMAVAGISVIGYLAATSASISMGTIRTPITSLYIFWLLLAGAVFRLKGLLLAAIISSLTILGLILAENAGYLPKPDYSVGLTQWLTYSTIFALGASLIYYANQRTRMALTRAENENRQRRRSDEELQSHLASLQLREQALNQISQGVLISDAGRRLTYVNDEAERITGYSRQDLLGQFCTLLQGPDTDADTVLRMRQAMDNGQAFSGDILNYRKDGTAFWNEITITPVFDAAGQVSQFVGVQRDISGRKNREQELRQLSEAVAQSTESIVITNLQAEIEYVNDAYVRNTGYSRSELMGRNSRLLQSGKTPHATYDALWQTLRQGQSWSGEFFNRRKDGSEFIEAAVISPIRGADGHVRNYVAAKRDITQAKLIQAELQQARQAAEAANLAKSQFLATMSHEVRTPMNGILGMAQVLSMPEVSQVERQDYARTILASGQTLLKLLNDILDLAKIEAGKVEFDSIEMTPTDILAQTQALFGVAASARGLQIESNWRGPTTRYRGDPHRLTQMLSNLVSNALKFTSQGSIRLEAREIANAASSPLLEFSVSDSGMGIASDKLGLLFQSFSQVDSSSSRQFGGTGLGLSIVRALARLMGGEAGVESKLGQGSRFWFRVVAEPVVEASGASPASRTSDAAGAPSAALYAGRVLLAEDNASHGRLIELLLGSLGIVVRAVSNGQQALDAIMQGESARVILMDLQMPLLDGYEATRRIRQWEQQNGQDPRVIIALTADAFEDDRQRCLDAGMGDVLTKPFSFERLKTVLAQWLPAGAAPLPRPSYAAIDVARVQALLRELEPMLEDLDFDAVARFRDLHNAVAGTELAAQLAPAVAALQSYQFDVVLHVLRQIMNTPTWQGEPHDNPAA